MTPNDSFPGDGPVTFDVQCWTAAGGEPATHPMTLHPDWTIETGHNPDLERIAVGLGGQWPSCFALAKKGIPAIREWRRLCRRLAGVPLRMGGRGGTRYLVDKSMARCSMCAVGGWDDVHKAMSHLRSLHHWAGVYQFPLERAERVWHDAVQAGEWWGEVNPDLGDRRVVDQGDLDGLRLFAYYSSPPRPKGFTDLGYSHYEAELLWDAGIHPEWASEMNNLLGPTEPVWQNTLVELAVRHVPPDWLAQFKGMKAVQVDWAVRHYVSFDGANPTARVEWLRVGVGPKTVERLLGRTYTPDDVIEVAGIMNASLNTAGEYLADWLDADCQPTIEQIKLIFDTEGSLREAPTAAMISRLRGTTQINLRAWDNNTLGTLVATSGSVAAARYHLCGAIPRGMADD